jgi:hypothetical protein
VLEIHHSNPGKHARSHQVHIQREPSLFFLHRLDCQVWIEPFPPLNDTSAWNGMIHTTVFLQRSFKKRNIVGVFSDVCREKSDSRGGRKRREEFFRGLGCKVAKDDGGAGFVEKADGGGANTICAA